MKASFAVLEDKTDLKHSQLEAAIMVDSDIVGRGLFFSISDKKFLGQLYVFLDNNKLSLKEIEHIYGVPKSKYKGPGGCLYFFYGRIFFCLVPGSKIPYVARFNISNSTANSPAKSLKK